MLFFSCICSCRCSIYSKLCPAFMWSKRSNPIKSTSLFPPTAPASARLHCMTRTLVFRFESIRGEGLSVSSPSCLHEKPRHCRIWKGEATMPMQCFKSDAVRVFGIICRLGSVPEGLEVPLGSVYRCRFVADCCRSRKPCTVLLSNLFNAFVIALHFITSCAKP